MKIQDDGLTVDLFDSSTQQIFVNRLKSRYRHEVMGIGSKKLGQIVEEGMKLCKPLKIHDEKNVFRFIALSVLLTPQQKKSHLIEDVYKRVISNTKWSANKRLDFLYAHIVGRPVSNNEMDFGWKTGKSGSEKRKTGSENNFR